jgi:hypothetical protein
MRGIIPKDAKLRREEKMERGRREMSNKKQLREIRKRIEENEKKGKGTENSLKIGASFLRFFFCTDLDVGIDEEVFRECVLLEIQVAVKNSFDNLDLIDQVNKKKEKNRNFQLIFFRNCRCWSAKSRCSSCRMPKQTRGKSRKRTKMDL